MVERFKVIFVLIKKQYYTTCFTYNSRPFWVSPSSFVYWPMPIWLSYFCRDKLSIASAFLASISYWRGLPGLALFILILLKQMATLINFNCVKILSRISFSFSSLLCKIHWYAIVTYNNRMNAISSDQSVHQGRPSHMHIIVSNFYTSVLFFVKTLYWRNWILSCIRWKKREKFVILSSFQGIYSSEIPLYFCCRSFFNTNFLLEILTRLTVPRGKMPSLVKYIIRTLEL